MGNPRGPLNMIMLAMLLGDLAIILRGSPKITAWRFYLFYPVLTSCTFIMTSWCLATHDWVGVVWFGFLTVILVWDWWNDDDHRRRRRKLRDRAAALVRLENGRLKVSRLSTK